MFNKTCKLYSFSTRLSGANPVCLSFLSLAVLSSVCISPVCSRQVHRFYHVKKPSTALIAREYELVSRDKYQLHAGIVKLVGRMTGDFQRCGSPVSEL